MFSLASSAYRRVLVSALTSVVLHATGFHGSDFAASVHSAVRERTKFASPSANTDLVGGDPDSRRYVQADGSTQRRLANVSLQPLVNLGQHDGTVPRRQGDHLIYFEGGSSYYNTTSETFEAVSTATVSYFTVRAVQLAYSYGICNGAVVSNLTLNVGTTSAFYDQCADING